MGMLSNTGIVTSGLTYGFDMFSLRSYKGTPGTNLLQTINPDGLSVSANNNYRVSSGTENVFVPGIGFMNNVSYVDVMNDYNNSYGGGGSGNCCPRIVTFGSGFAVSPNTTYTYAIVYKATSGYTNSNYMYQYHYTSNGGSYVTEFGLHDTNKRISLGDGWYWAWNTFTTGATVNWVGTTGMWHYEYRTYSRVYVAKAMMMQGDWTLLHPKYWPNVATTRSTSQSLFDITGNRTITQIGFTHKSDGTFSLPGTTNNGIDTGINIHSSAQGYSAGFTVSAWFSTTTIGTSQAIFQNQPPSSNTGIRITINSGFSGNIGWGYNDVSSYILNTVCTPGIPFNVTWTYSPSDATKNRIYRNGVQVYSNTATINDPSTNLFIGRYTTGSLPFNGSIFSALIYNRPLSANEVLNNYNATKARFVGSSEDNPALSATAIRLANPSVTDGVYWIRPRGATTAYQCYCQFNYLGNDWFVVSGMSSSGVRADANGNNSGLAGLLLAGENTGSATLAGTSTGNNNGLNFTLPRDWINACKPRALRVKSPTQDMTALFNKTGNYVTADDIWSYYYAMNSYDNVPSANGRNHTAATVNSWLNTNVKIYQGTSMVGNGSLWSGNHHCGWSDGNHMLHGSTNFTFASGSYVGFCLDGTCWNESGIVWLATG